MKRMKFAFFSVCALLKRKKNRLLRISIYNCHEYKHITVVIGQILYETRRRRLQCCEQHYSPCTTASTKFTTRIRSNSPGSVSAVLPERPRCRVKATRAALCVNQIPNTGCTRLCAIPHPPSTGYTLSRRLSSPPPPVTRARAYAYLFNVQKAECTREKYSHYIALVLLRDRGFTVYTGATCPKRKGCDMCKHACSRVVMAGAGPIDSTELYRQSPADIKGTMRTDCPKVIYTLLARPG